MGKAYHSGWDAAEKSYFLQRYRSRGRWKCWKLPWFYYKDYLEPKLSVASVTLSLYLGTWWEQTLTKICKLDKKIFNPKNYLCSYPCIKDSWALKASPQAVHKCWRFEYFLVAVEIKILLRNEVIKLKISPPVPFISTNLSNFQLQVKIKS